MNLELISFDICPYVERSRIVLEEKGVDYDLTLIDLSNKPDWFLQISPRGKVPVLRVDGSPVFESAVINELLDELFPDKPMFPRDAVDRAQARSWIVFCNDVLMPEIATIWFSSNTEKIEAAKVAFQDGMKKVEEELASNGENTFFMGDEFGLIDAVFAPIFSRWEATRALGYEDLFESTPLSLAYGMRLLEHPAAMAARPKNLTQEMLDYLARRNR